MNTIVTDIALNTGKNLDRRNSPELERFFETRCRLKRSFRQNNGMITWGILLSLLLLMILVAFVSNIAIVVNRKMEVQNSADAIAYSSTVWIARGMNSLTATNHVIGELNAFYTIHHAVGGKWLDKHGPSKKRNSGDWDFNWFPPFGFGGLAYQITNITLTVTYYTAWILDGITNILKWIHPLLPGDGPGLDGNKYDRVKKHPIADINSAIWEGKENLKNQMIIVYALNSAGSTSYINGWTLYYTPDYYPPIFEVPFPFNFRNQRAGKAQMKAGAATKERSKTLERVIHAEYVALDVVESNAIRIAEFKLKLPVIIQAVHSYQKLSVNLEIPAKAIATAKNIAKRTGCIGFALGDFPEMPSGGSMADVPSSISIFPKLPVEPEKVTREGRSQMVRATYPWVRKWRYKLHKGFLVTTPTSGAADGFIKWTNKYAMQSSQWLRTDTGQYCDNALTVVNRRGRSRGEKGKGVRMYTIVDLDDRGRKSQESWNKQGLAGSKRADELFCFMGYAKSKENPKTISNQFFRQENPHGIVCYSQAMIYNANKQSPPAGSSAKNQPYVSWDTLAWDHQQQRIREWEDPGYWDRLWDTVSAPEPAPKIKLNWQAKLTPATVFKMAKTAPGVMLLDADVRATLLNAREAQFVLQNH